MKFLRTLRGLVVINQPDDSDLESMEVKVVEEKKPKKKKKKESVDKSIEEDPLYRREHVEVTCVDRMLYDKWFHVAYILFLIVFLGLILPFILTSAVFEPEYTGIDGRGYCYINDSYKYRCFSEFENVNKSTCEAAKCCFIESNIPDVPWCYHTTPSEYGYKILNSSTIASYTRHTRKVQGVEGIVDEEFQRAHYKLGNYDSLSFNLNPVTNGTLYDGQMWNVTVLVERGGDDYIRITAFSPDHEEGTFIKDNTNFAIGGAENPKLDVEVLEDAEGAFNLTIYRYGHQEQLLLRTIFGPFIMGDGNMELTTTFAPSAVVHGLGSHFPESPDMIFEEYKSWTFNSIDPSFSNQSRTDTHPFYLAIDPTEGQACGVYVKNSAPMQINAVPAPGLSFKTYLGTFTVLVMAGTSPNDVSKQYHDLLNPPTFPPYWAYGFHMCRTVAEKDQKKAFTDVYNAMKGQLPFEGDCIDSRLSYPDPYGSWADWISSTIDLMQQTDGKKFYLPNYPFLVNESPAYLEALAYGVLLKLPEDTPYYGKVSSTTVGYPDYIDENSYGQWLSKSQLIGDRISKADALFLLQNSPLNEAVVNYEMSENITEFCSPNMPELCCRMPPYNFVLDPLTEIISNGSICWEVVHKSLAKSKHLAHHNSYGYYHTYQMHELYNDIKPNTRPMVLSSSTHPGSGSLGGHFSEGFGISINEQKRALQSVLSLSLAGMPLVGVPACGTLDDNLDFSEDEWNALCFRSYQMSIFFPLFISHYEMGQKARNPPDVRDGFSSQLKPYILLRYSLLPTIYTAAEELARLGIPMVRSLGYEYPEDEDARAITDQFMLGPSLMVVPNFENETKLVTVQVPVYYPAGNWYDFFSGLIKSNEINGTFTYLSTVSTDVNLLIKGGKAVFLQGNLHDNINQTEEARNQTYTIMAALSLDQNNAEGFMYYDDGHTPRSDPSYSATKLTATVSNSTQSLIIRRNPIDGGDDVPRYCDNVYSSTIQGVIIYGLGLVDNVIKDNAIVLTEIKQDPITLALEIPGVDFDWCKNSITNITWTYASY